MLGLNRESLESEMLSLLTVCVMRIQCKTLPMTIKGELVIQPKIVKSDFKNVSTRFLKIESQHIAGVGEIDLDSFLR